MAPTDICRLLQTGVRRYVLLIPSACLLRSSSSMARLARVVAINSPDHITRRGSARQVVFEDDPGRLVDRDPLRQHCRPDRRVGRRKRLHHFTVCREGCSSQQLALESWEPDIVRDRWARHHLHAKADDLARSRSHRDRSGTGPHLHSALPDPPTRATRFLPVARTRAAHARGNPRSLSGQSWSALSPNFAES